LDNRAAYLKQYAEENQDKLAIYQKEYAETHKDELQIYRKEYYQKTKTTLESHWRQLKSSAGRRKLPVEISFEQYIKLVESNACYYCQDILTACGYNIDRLDHLKGYIVGNVAPCCWDCNARKGALERAGFRYPRTVELLREILFEMSKLRD